MTDKNLSFLIDSFEAHTENQLLSSTLIEESNQIQQFETRGLEKNNQSMSIENLMSLSDAIAISVGLTCEDKENNVLQKSYSLPPSPQDLLEDTNLNNSPKSMDDSFESLPPPPPPSDIEEIIWSSSGRLFSPFSNFIFG